MNAESLKLFVTPKESGVHIAARGANVEKSGRVNYGAEFDGIDLDIHIDVARGGWRVNLDSFRAGVPHETIYTLHDPAWTNAREAADGFIAAMGKTEQEQVFHAKDSHRAELLAILSRMRAEMGEEPVAADAEPTPTKHASKSKK